jgi:uracil-DNA glycosylase family 4
MNIVYLNATYMTELNRLKLVNTAIQKKFKDKKLVFGSGTVGARIVFVGEAPGSAEEKEGKPMTGGSMKLLNHLLRTIGLDKRKVYLTNVLKYTAIKTPSPKEIKSHVPFLKEEIKTVGPQIVVTLGTMALNGVGLRQPLDNVHGRVINFGHYELLPTFHPQVALNNPQVKTLLETDFLKLKELLKVKQVA